MKNIKTKQEKIELLRNAGLFSMLKEKELEIVAKYSEYYDFEKGKTVFAEGSKAGELHIIKDGEIVIRKEAKKGRQKDIARYISGNCFGEMDLLENIPRTASAIADKKTTVLTFPRRGIKFKEVLSNHPEVSANILHKLLVIIAGRIRSTNKLVSEKTPWVEDLRIQLLNDKLTGLYNRTFLDEDLATLLPGYNNKTCVLVIKPDNFKIINDNYGHDAGDKSLVIIANTIKTVIRKNDIAARYKGDEYSVILPDTDIKNAYDICEKLKYAINNIDVSDFISDENFKILVSIGFSVYPDDSTNNKKLLKSAYDKMLKARNNGGNRIVK